MLDARRDRGSIESRTRSYEDLGPVQLYMARGSAACDDALVTRCESLCFLTDSCMLSLERKLEFETFVHSHQ